MANYNERLDKIVNNLSGKYSGSIASAMLAGGHPGETIFMMNKYGEEAKQSLTSLIEELVAEAKPRTMPSNLSPENYEKCERVVNQYHQNLLKALSKEK